MNQWAFYSFTYSKSQQLASFYKNGILVQSFNNSGAQLENTATGSVYLAYSPVGTDEYSNYILDDVRHYNRALTAAQVLTLYQQEYLCDSTVLSVNESTVQHSSGIHIYPDPADSYFTIETSAIAYIKICDLLGRPAAELKGAPSGSTTIEVKNREKGLYFVWVTDAQTGLSQCRRLIVD